jgi:hypothetical protein
MGYFRFRRVFNLFPGLRLNLSKSGVSASSGVEGLHYTVGPKGTRTTVGLPGSGLSYTDYHPCSKSLAVPPPVVPLQALPSVSWFKRIFGGGQDDRIAVTSELEAFKAETRTAFEQAQAKDKVSATNNLLTGDTISELIEAFKNMISKIEESLKLETPLDGVLLMLGKLSFFIRLTAVEPLQVLDFVVVRTPGGGYNTKEAVVGIFVSFADFLDTMADSIRSDIKNKVPSAKIYSSYRRRGRSGELSEIMKMMGVMEQLFEKDKFSVEWGSFALSSD